MLSITHVVQSSICALETKVTILVDGVAARLSYGCQWKRY
jgi:hypothetical protein